MKRKPKNATRMTVMVTLDVLDAMGFASARELAEKSVKLDLYSGVKHVQTAVTHER